MAEPVTFKTSALDRALISIAPGWALNRIRSRAAAVTLARHYEAASIGRRTENWRRSTADANAANRPALVSLRGFARDLVRNNAYAKRACQAITNNTVGWGIHPKAEGGSEKIAQMWKRWAGTTECDADGRLTFYGLQALAMRTIVESGEVLIRRRYRRTSDGFTIPLQLQVLEPDFIDINKDGIVNQENDNPIIQGVEFDKLGRRVAYWLYNRHPGSNRIAITYGGGGFVSNRVPAKDVIHVYELGRPGQVRGITWFAPIILPLKDFDEYEDASLMQAKVAALFAAIITSLDGDPVIGEKSATDPLVETLEPGMMYRTRPGEDVKFGQPPVAPDNGFSSRTLHRIAAGFGVTYEDITGDYSQVNFSSARMARNAHWANVNDWQWNMLIPQLCDGVWGWAMEAAALAGVIGVENLPLAEWTPAPMPMIDPEKEGLALTRLVRSGAMTHDDMLRERGIDPEAHWKAYAERLKKLDELGIVLDSDVRRVSQAGLTQVRAGAAGGDGAADEGGEGGKKKGEGEDAAASE